MPRSAAQTIAALGLRSGGNGESILSAVPPVAETAVTNSLNLVLRLPP